MENDQIEKVEEALLLLGEIKGVPADLDARTAVALKVRQARELLRSVLRSASEIQRAE